MKRNSNGNDWNKYLKHHPDIIEMLIKIINIPICLENDNININTKSRLINSFLNIIYYTPYNDIGNENTLNRIIQYLYENYKKYNLNTLGTNISIILKNIKDFTHGKLIPEKFEEIIIYYLNNIDYSYICDNEIFHLLIESSANINYSKIKNIIYSKIKGDDPANKYIIERMRNKCLCYESCMEILSNERFSNSIRRMAIVDYLKNFLKTNGVKESTVIYDDQLYSEGEAIGKLIKINSNQLNITCFHEAIHIIQHNDFEQEKYYGNSRYL